MGNEKRRKGISIFRASDAVNQRDADFRAGPPTMSQESREHFAAMRAAGRGTGVSSQLLVRQGEEEGGFSLVLIWFKPNYPLPRHSHDSDCMYYVVSGSLSMGRVTLRAGDGFYAPADAMYVYSAGPEGAEVLEIRHGVSQFDMVIPDASPEFWEAAMKATVENHEQWEKMETSPTFAANRPES